MSGSGVVFWPGDIVCMKGGSWLAKAIRWATRSRGEGATVVNHVGLVTQPGDEDDAIVVEALNHVEAKTFASSTRKKSVAVFRPKNVTQGQIDLITDYMESRIGDRYGYHKLGLHLLQKIPLPGKWRILNIGASKWLNSRIDKTPICSYIVAEAYHRAGLDFGVKASLATPDDIWDFCVSEPDKYSVLLYQF
jgi:hypothetical protein